MAKHEPSTTQGRAGNALGTVATESRTALLRELERQLDTTPWRRMTVPALAREIGCAPATFYQYFANIEDAFHALMKDRADQHREPTEHLQLIADLLRCEAS